MPEWDDIAGTELDVILNDKGVRQFFDLFLTFLPVSYSNVRSPIRKSDTDEVITSWPTRI